MPDVNRTPELRVVQNIPAVFIPAPGPLVGGIQFRVGRMDDPPHRLGLSHLVEHLVMTTLDEPEYFHNASVGPEFTEFYCSGEPNEVVEFLNHVGRALANPSFDRLDHEKRVTEIEMKGAELDSAGVLMILNYGISGLGGTRLPNRGISHLTPDEITQFIRTYFTLGNASLWFTGQPPQGLDLQLPNGSRRMPSCKPLANTAASYPRYLPSENPLLGVSFRMPPILGATIVCEALERRLERHLRHDLGVAYSVDSTSYTLGTEGDFAVLITDVASVPSLQLTTEFVRIVETFLDHGPSEDELARSARIRRRAVADPASIPEELSAYSQDLLLDRFDATWNAQLDALTPAQLIPILQVMRDSLTFLLPELPPESDLKIARIPEGNDSMVSGTSYRVGLLPLALTKQRLVVGEDGFTWVEKDGASHTILFKDLLFAERFTNEQGTRTYQFTGEDSSCITLCEEHPKIMKTVMPELLAHLPSERIIDGVDETP